MFKTNSIAGRLAVSKTLGLVVGLLAVLSLPLIPVETTLEFKIGVILLVMLMSVTIGLFGIFTHHPMFPKWKMPWWFRGSLVGVTYMLMLVLLAKDAIEPFMSINIVVSMGLTSPYWALIDGAIIGAFIGYVTTRLCGEGDLPIK